MRAFLARTLELAAWSLEDLAERIDSDAASAEATKQARLGRQPLIERTA